MAGKARALEGPARVLVVADQPIAGFVALALSHGIFETQAVATVDEARLRRADWGPHLLIVDVDVDGGHGLALVGEHPGAQRTPTIVITERGDLKTKLAAFDSGADDFISSPTTPEEFVARALAPVRCSYGNAVPFVPRVALAGLEIDLLNRRATVGGKDLELTPMEEALLYLLASNPDRTLDRDEILNALCGSEFIAECNLIDRHIRNLRTKLGEDFRRPRFIKTVAGAAIASSAVRTTSRSAELGSQMSVVHDIVSARHDAVSAGHDARCAVA